jgi:hypothetical protein
MGGRKAWKSDELNSVANSNNLDKVSIDLIFYAK